ncbi:MAG: efflux RND transporter permease subunit [Pseudomonadota bacterium]
MSSMNNFALRLGRSVFKASWLLLALVLIVSVGAVSQLRHFDFDASTDTLVAENDEALNYFLEVSENFGDESFLFLTYAPKDGALFAPNTLAQLATLQSDLEAVEGVSGVTSILDVPLVRSPPIPLTEIATSYKTLRMDDVDLDLAKTELMESPLFRELLVSADGSATAMRVNLASDQSLNQLRQTRQDLRDIEDKTSEQEARLSQVEEDYRVAKRVFAADQERLISDIRSVRDRYSDQATVYLAGVPMIASDMIRYVRDDIATFGWVSLVLIMLILFLYFRQLRWVLLPVFTALLGVLVTAGILGLIRQPVSVISANFVALLIIFSISFTMHLIVRYRELSREQPDESPKSLLTLTMVDKFAPCIYTAVTTMVAFASLTASGIVPVVDLGWIMCLAMTVAFVMNYTFFPALIHILPDQRVVPLPERQPIVTRVLRVASVNAPWVVVIVSIFAAFVSVFGLERLSTESRFIDYFRNSSEIKQGLVFVDETLGGTTPMDVIVNFSPYEDESFGDDDFFAEEEDAYPERYWYTPDKIVKLRELEAYLATKPEVGKIISIATLEEIARSFNDGEALNTVELAAILGLLPEDLRREFLLPYSSPRDGILRISMRMKETVPATSRDALIQDIESFAINEVGFEPRDVNVTGMNVLFNNMLNLLFDSQRSTIQLVLLATFLMLFALLRSLRLAIIGVVPNILSAALVLAFMGFMRIPLDIMTMTIAAIIIGIGVDDAIHFLHRFKQEKALGRTTKEAVDASHKSVGFALYFTSVTVIVGFSVLGLSNFIPTIYFGLLTAMAMGLSLVVNLGILPSLLMVMVPDDKTFGPSKA